MPSSVIRRFQYDEEGRTLRVWFVSGAVYDYVDVPPEVPQAFRAALSKGEFFSKVIRPYFDFEKVRDAKEDGWSPGVSG